MPGFARIVWDERVKRRYWLKKKNSGVVVRKFRAELKRQGVKFTETHHPLGRFNALHLKDREIVEFKW